MNWIMVLELQFQSEWQHEWVAYLWLLVKLGATISTLNDCHAPNSMQQSSKV